VPKATNLFNNAYEKGSVRAQVYAKERQEKEKQEESLTSSGEPVDAWASRETSGSLAFFGRLLLRVFGTFLIEALVTLGAVTGSGGSAAVIGDIEGAAESSFGGSSSSL
jgi:hypothetical protein